VFERALEVRKRDPGNTAAIAWAQFAVGQTLRTLGQADEAVRLLEQAAQTLPGEDEIRDELDAARG